MKNNKKEKIKEKITLYLKKFVIFNRDRSSYLNFIKGGKNRERIAKSIPVRNW